MTTQTTTIRSQKTATTKRQPQVFSYQRFSHANQVHGRSTKRQSGLAEKWCADNGHTLASVQAFRDHGVSAFKKRNAAEHGDLRRFLDLIEAGVVQRGDILLIEALDRLSRKNVNVAQELLLSIINRGVVVVTLIDNAVYRDDADPHTLMGSLIMSLAIFMRAHDESRTKSARKADSWKAKREAALTGAYHGGRTPSWIKVVDGKYVVIPEKAKLVRDIITDYVAGLGLYKLHQKYGVSMPTIGTWLDSASVVGTLVMKDGDQQIEVPNHYPAILDPTTYKAALKQRASRYVNRRRGAADKYTNIFAGLLRDVRGQKMIVAMHNGRTDPASRVFKSQGCIIRARYLEEVIITRKMPNKFVRVREVVAEEPTDPKALAKIEADMKQIQAAMMEEPAMAARLLPVMRKLEQQRKAMAGTAKEVRDGVDSTYVGDLLDDNDAESRQRLRDIASQSIKSIKLKVESSNWYMHVHGVVTLTDGIACPFSFAYNTRREGYLITDGQPQFNFFYGDFTGGAPLPKLTDAIKEQLNQFPLLDPPTKKPKA